MMKMKSDTEASNFDACNVDTRQGRGDVCGAATADTAATIRNCGAGKRLCGYELMRHLDFAQSTSYAGNSPSVNTTWCPNATNGCNHNSEAGFPGLGASGSNNGFKVIFEGNGYTISHLYMRGGGDVGFFRRIENTAKIRNIGILSSNVYDSRSANDALGILVGSNFGSITASYSTGSIHASSGGDFDSIGGLVGSNSGTVTDSYARVVVYGGVGNNDYVGGLVGSNSGSISHSYATEPGGWWSGWRLCWRAGGAKY